MSACWWKITYSHIAPPMRRGRGVSLLILRALQRLSLRCAHIAERLSLLIRGRAINKIISSVAQYFQIPFALSFARRPSPPPSRTKKVKDGRLTVRKQRLSNYSSAPPAWVSLLKQASGVHASVLRIYAKRVFDH